MIRLLSRPRGEILKTMDWIQARKKQINVNGKGIDWPFVEKNKANCAAKAREQKGSTAEHRASCIQN